MKLELLVVELKDELESLKQKLDAAGKQFEKYEEQLV